MPARFLPLLLASALIASHTAPLNACGDKLLLLGRGIRFQSRHTAAPAAVLLYLPAAIRSGGILADPQLESALKEAGHEVRAVATREELMAALHGSRYDVVLADLGEAAELRRTIQATDAVVLPVVYLVPPARRPESKTDRKAAEREFGVALQVPGRRGHYCALVDKAMELKLKRDRSAASK